MAEKGETTGSTVFQPDKDVKSAYSMGNAKEEISDGNVQHDKETHGKSDDIDEKTPVEEVKGPSVIQRAKEEVEAMVGSILPGKK